MSLQPANGAELRNATELRNAVKQYDVDRVNYLLSHGVDPDSVAREKDQTALMVCVNSRALTPNESYNWRCDTIAEHLLLKGASPFLTDKWGQSALYLASRDQDIPMIQIMSRVARMGPTDEFATIETVKQRRLSDRALAQAELDADVIEGPPPRAPRGGYSAR